MRQSIVLIGPSGVGKTTVGMLLSDHLGMSFLDLDDLRARYYDDFGIDRTAEREAYGRDGLAGITTCWKPFEVLSVERVLREYPQKHVIAFGRSVRASPSDARPIMHDALLRRSRRFAT